MRTPHCRLELVTWFFCAVLLVLLVSNNGVLVHFFVNDLAGFTFDSMSRSAAGQVPHSDYYSPLGHAFYWPFTIVSKIIPLQATTIFYANALVAVIALAFSTLLLRKRLATPLFCLSLLLILATVISPREFASPPWIFGHQAIYNSWGWALLLILALALLVPRPASSARASRCMNSDAIDGAAIGALFVLLFLLKVTYFVAGGVLVMAGLVLRTVSLRSLLISAVTFVLLLGIVELAFQNLSNYLSDLRMAMDAARAEPINRQRKMRQHLYLGGIVGLIVVAALWLLQPTRSIVNFVWLWWREILVGAAIVACRAPGGHAELCPVRMSSPGCGADRRVGTRASPSWKRKLSVIDDLHTPVACRRLDSGGRSAGPHIASRYCVCSYASIGLWRRARVRGGRLARDAFGEASVPTQCVRGHISPIHSRLS